MTVCRIKIKHVSLKVCTNKGISRSGNKNFTPISAISVHTLPLYHCNAAGDLQMDLSDRRETVREQVLWGSRTTAL